MRDGRRKLSDGVMMVEAWVMGFSGVLFLNLREGEVWAV